MSDRSSIRKMLTRASIQFEEKHTGDFHRDTNHVLVPNENGVRLSGSWQIEVNEGYPGFYTVFDFNDDGSLKTVEAYE